MNLYLDLEVNEPRQDIISIGIVDEQGCGLHINVNSGQPLHPYIKSLTGLSEEVLQRSPTLSQAIENVVAWILKRDPLFPLTIYTYGNCDKGYLQANICYAKDIFTKDLIRWLLAMTEDLAPEIAKSFGEDSITLREAYARMFPTSFIPELHIAFDDAMMLRDIHQRLIHKNLCKNQKRRQRDKKSKYFAKECPEILDEKYNITFKAQKGNRKPHIYHNVREALPISGYLTFTTAQEKLAAMEELYQVILKGKGFDGWKFEIVKNF